jgi:excinuclease ABC subunit C
VLTDSIEFQPEHDFEVFAAVPAAPAVFLLRGEDAQSEPYVSKTANLRRRLQRLLAPPEERSKKLNLRDRVRHVEFAQTGSDFESGFLLYLVLREAFPKTYAKRLRCRFAPFVRLHLENEYPRFSVTTRISRPNGRSVFYGPFFTRVAAEKFMNDSLDFFKMRRCVDDLHPDPKFPGCIYSEMKMCLAPCFKGCTDDEYAKEVSRVQNYFDSAGDSLLRELSGEREAASANLAFEDAAAIHVRVEKLKPIVSQLPEIVQRLDRLSALMIQPSHIAGSVAFFRIANGQITGPVAFSIQPAEHTKSQSMESRVQESLQAFAPENSAGAKGKSTLETMEHLALLKRWYYRGTRIGEIFFADAKGELPMRRVVRGISRVFRGEKPEGDNNKPAENLQSL